MSGYLRAADPPRRVAVLFLQCSRHDPVSSSDAEPLIIPLRDRRENVAAFAELGTQALAAYSIVSAGRAALAGPGTGRMLGMVEVAAGVLLLAAIVFEARALRRGGEPGTRMSWVSLFAAGVLFVEIWQRMAAGGKFSRATFVTAIATLVIGYVRPRMARRRVLRLDGDGLAFRLNRFRRLHLRWSDVESVHVDAGIARFRLRDGRERTLALRRFYNAAELSTAIAGAANRAGVRTAGAAIGSAAAPPKPLPEPGS